MATYSLSALQRSRRKFMRIYWVAGLRKWRPTGSFRPRLCKNSDTLSKFALVLKF